MIKKLLKRLKKDDDGFTLIELMVVVIIIGILAAILVPNLMGRTEEARVNRVKSDLNTIATEAQMYRMENSEWPGSGEDPASDDAFDDLDYDDDPEDPWDNPYEINGDGGEFEIKSLGKNEGDDITLTIDENGHKTIDVPSSYEGVE